MICFSFFDIVAWNVCARLCSHVYYLGLLARTQNFMRNTWHCNSFDPSISFNTRHTCVWLVLQDLGACTHGRHMHSCLPSPWVLEWSARPCDDSPIPRFHGWLIWGYAKRWNSMRDQRWPSNWGSGWVPPKGTGFWDLEAARCHCSTCNACIHWKL